MASATPVPSATLALTKITLPAGTHLHRVHLGSYGASQFNPGVKGNARFSPIKDATGSAVPTIYAATSFQAAAMETVFHDVPFAAGLKTMDMAKLDGQAYSTLQTSRDFVLADLCQVALRKLGISRAELIDTEKASYPDTRLWAIAIHTQFPDVEGLFWVSRQDDSARALVLFGDRIKANDLTQIGSPRSLLGDMKTNALVVALSKNIGVSLMTPFP